MSVESGYLSRLVEDMLALSEVTAGEAVAMPSGHHEEGRRLSVLRDPRTCARRPVSKLTGSPDLPQGGHFRNEARPSVRRNQEPRKADRCTASAVLEALARHPKTDHITVEVLRNAFAAGKD